ncbi:lysine tRS [Acrasis kona]|uniref:Lysine tRS n=1 Tax=Acrasis kona TaxID=1008807 RepID=A0AAW2YW79_9EUKA
MNQSLRLVKARSLLNTVCVRSYAVQAVTDKPYNTSAFDFVANTDVDERANQSKFEYRLLDLFKKLKPITVTEDVQKYAQDYFVQKAIKRGEISANAKTFPDYGSRLQLGSIIKIDDRAMERIYPGYKNALKDFFEHRPLLSPVMMDTVLALNEDEYEKIQAKRIEKIFDFCRVEYSNTLEEEENKAKQSQKPKAQEQASEKSADNSQAKK